MTGPSGAGSHRLPCPVCEHPAAVHRWALSDRLFRVASGTFDLYECPGCGLLFQDPSRIPEDLGCFYPAGYWWADTGSWLSRRELGYRRWMVQRDHLRFVEKLGPVRRERRLLDIGAGGGLFASLALASGWDAWGLEVSAAAAAAAEPDMRGRILVGDRPETAETAGPFDVVTMFHTLEHVRDPFQYLRKIQKLLPKPGHLVVQVPNRSSWQARVFGRRWYGLDCPRHLYNFSLYSVLFLLGRAGYRIRRVRHFSLRDNAASLVSSLAPGWDPIARRIRAGSGSRGSWGATVATGLYFGAFLAAQPLAWLESRAGRGGTVMVWASWDA